MHCVEYSVSTLRQLTTITLTINTTQKFQDARGQIGLEKTWAQFRAFGLNHPKPDRSDQRQFNNPNFCVKNRYSHKGKYYPSHPIQCR